MSFSIHSPLSSEVFSSFDSLSPPPAPIGKRAQYFFPSNYAAPPTPFPAQCQRRPSNATVADEEGVVGKKLALLASRTVPMIKLMPRPRTGGLQAGMALTQIRVDQCPPLPFQFPNESYNHVESSTGQSPSPPDSSKSTNSEKRVLGLGPKKPVPVASRTQQAKLPAYQRRGTHRPTSEKRNSFAARSA